MRSDHGLDGPEVVAVPRFGYGKGEAQPRTDTTGIGMSASSVTSMGENPAEASRFVRLA
jgi:hypothetical protein